MVFNRAKALTLSAPGEEAGAIGFPPPPGRSPPVKGRRDPRDGASQGPPSPPRGAESSRATRPNDQSRARDCCSLPIRWRVHSERTIAKGNPKGSPTSLAGGKGEEPLRVKGAREGERRGPRKAFYSPSSAHPAVRSLGPSSDLKGSSLPTCPARHGKGSTQWGTIVFSTCSGLRGLQPLQPDTLACHLVLTGGRTRQRRHPTVPLVLSWTAVARVPRVRVFNMAASLRAKVVRTKQAAWVWAPVG